VCLFIERDTRIYLDVRKVRYEDIIRNKVILATDARMFFACAASIFCSLKATSGSWTSCLDSQSSRWYVSSSTC